MASNVDLCVLQSRETVGNITLSCSYSACCACINPSCEQRCWQEYKSFGNKHCQYIELVSDVWWEIVAQATINILIAVVEKNYNFSCENAVLSCCLQKTDLM